MIPTETAKAPKSQRSSDGRDPGGRRRESADIDRLNRLAFANRKAIASLVRFRERELPKVASRLGRRKTAALFEQFVEMALQGNSVHPNNSVQLAEVTKGVLAKGGRAPKVLRILEQLLVGEDLQPMSGNNALHFARPELVVAHEHQRRTGGFEVAYKVPVKYHAYEESVRESSGFWRDWVLIKRHYRVDRFRDGKGLLRRSPNPEYNWRREKQLSIGEERTAFQVIFDFFCWKWFLWGMRREEPMVEQLFYAITPYGTQIFIPGYWSLDASRDVCWDEIKKLHAARGVPKQGEKAAANRRQRTKRLKMLLEADVRALKDGIRGAARYVLLKQAAGLVLDADDAQIRRLLREARASHK